MGGASSKEIDAVMQSDDNPTAITHVSHEQWTKEGLAIVVVGASGDLAKKKTYPSLL
eukprot:CAMPEP_0201676436 /NCGR_PEP_ID=MMETSP0494-20130426/41752_1 /ASSEMBLY_ACC=CAM_ASM_000839 /TAXON_ID=420259 /ORGANISM="Thalassiosira gravida, Strain GMp14c1" /LENGTH=56 /DNA_ID=CAMNT_0048159153 /DNA_START=24 /DNA_END=190 /DNA_ORIENTATION=+